MSLESWPHNVCGITVIKQLTHMCFLITELLWATVAGNDDVAVGDTGGFPFDVPEGHDMGWIYCLPSYYLPCYLGSGYDGCHVIIYETFAPCPNRIGYLMNCRVE